MEGRSCGVTSNIIQAFAFRGCGMPWKWPGWVVSGPRFQPGTSKTYGGLVSTWIINVEYFNSEL
jgi:hypothetical protein